MPAPETTEAPTYRIKTVLDFCFVPAGRRETCLREFRVWLEMHDAGRAMLSNLPVKWPDEFVWIDDGAHTATMSVSFPDGESIPIASGVMRGFGK